MIKKILVVGAGIAGPTVCYWLKKFGFSPTLFEKNDILRQGGQDLDIHTELHHWMDWAKDPQTMDEKLDYINHTQNCWMSDSNHQSDDFLLPPL